MLNTLLFIRYIFSLHSGLFFMPPSPALCPQRLTCTDYTYRLPSLLGSVAGDYCSGQKRGKEGMELEMYSLFASFGYATDYQTMTFLRKVSASTNCIPHIYIYIYIYIYICVCVCVFNFLLFLLFHRLVMSNSLGLHGLQHARLPCPSPFPGACSNSCPLIQ